ncbi:hypothetical protein DM02DRAFT_167219 [Periconia macrospinosa]|uniref:Uncharacterized protein n=1 Tax=Periconia macrospinosa TaxID=97972 RepID=A0A2V1E2V3_9PLEO|nr:hypothetical protein DM02DRAFT_167219 [Periconia macrospinosa]
MRCGRALPVLDYSISRFFARARTATGNTSPCLRYCRTCAVGEGRRAHHSNTEPTCVRTLGGTRCKGVGGHGIAMPCVISRVFLVTDRPNTKPRTSSKFHQR